MAATAAKRLPRTGAVVPVRLKAWDDDLGVYVLSGIGHRAVCGDHYKGPIRRRRPAAEADLHWHREDEHP